MGKKQKKQLSKIADAVSSILGDGVKKKKLKKRKALRSFIAKMEERQAWIKDELKKGELKKDREKMLERHLETLDKQIKKAKDILTEMEK